MAEKVRNYPKLAADIVQEVGGPDNVAQASRCATRLRLVLNETPPEAKERVAAMPGVITVVQNSGQFQVVIGPHVGEVHEEVVRIVGVSEDSAGAAGPKQGIVSRIIATMSAVFAPIVYILAAAGLLQGLLILITMLAPGFAETGTYEVLSFMSWTPFTFLPIFIAITAAKHFRANQFIAVLCSAAIINPTWAEMATRIAEGETITFAGVALAPTTYTATVLPPLLLVWVLSYLQRALERVLHGVVRQIFVPLLCLVIMVPATLLIIGPLNAAAASGVADGFIWLVDNLPVLAGLLVGGLFQVLVIFGVHWGVLPVQLANFENYGFDPFQAYQTAAVIGQLGAVVGVFLKARNKELRRIAGAATLPGLFGITEPTIYGVTLRLKKPFLIGCISGGIGGAIIALFGARYYAFAGLPGPLTIVNAGNPEDPTSLVGQAIGCGVAFLLPILLVWVLGFQEPEVMGTAAQTSEEAARAEQTPEATADVEATAEAGAASGTGTSAAAGAAVSTGAATGSEAPDALVVHSPMSGRLLPMSEVPDDVFASGAMGAGVAIEPTGTQVRAPFSGKVVAVLPSKHAIGLRSDDGVELLIHVGIDTVALNGEGFTLHVAQRDTVQAGDLLLEFDPQTITGAGYPLITPLVITNTKKFTDIAPAATGTVAVGEPVITLVGESAEAATDQA